VGYCGILNDEFVVVPLSCFTRGLTEVNIVISRDVRFPNTQPCFLIKEWNELSEARNYVDKFKPLTVNRYFESVWKTE
jgi:hypothetical protein